PDLLLLSTSLAGARVLADRYGAMLNRMVVPKGRADWRAYANEFVEEAKALGAVQQFIERGGTRGINVAPAGDRSWPGGSTMGACRRYRFRRRSTGRFHTQVPSEDGR